MPTRPEEPGPGDDGATRRRPRQYCTPVFLVSLVGGAVTLGNGIIVPIVPLYAVSFGVSTTLAGALVAGFALGRVLANGPAGVAARRVGLRTTAATGCLLLMTSALVAGLASSFAVVLAARVVQGIGSAMYTTPAQTFVMETVASDRRGRAMSSFQGVLLVGFAIGPVVGGLMASLGDLRAPFFALAAVNVVTPILCLVLIPGRPPRAAADRRPRVPLVATVRSPGFSVPLMANVAVFSVRAGVRNTLLALYAAYLFGFTEGQIGLLLTAFTAVNVSVLPTVGRMLDRRGRKPVLLWGLVATAVLVALHGAAFHASMLVLATLLLAVASAFPSIAPMAIVADLADGHEGSAMVGVMRTGMDFGLLVGPVLAGALVDLVDYRATFVLFGVAVGVVALLCLRITETRPAAGPGTPGLDIS